MNKKALIVGLIYSLLYILFKFLLFVNNLTFERFWFNFAHILSVLALFPFFFISIYWIKKRDYEGVISGREAARMALTTFTVALLVTAVYNYIEFKISLPQQIAYYKGPVHYQNMLDLQLKNAAKFKVEQRPGIIEEQISSLSAIKATTGKLFSLLLLGVSGAFISALLLKGGRKLKND